MGSLLSGHWLVQGHTLPSPAFSLVQQVPEQVSNCLSGFLALRLHPTHLANAPPALTGLGLIIFKITHWVSDYKAVSIHFRQLRKFKRQIENTTICHVCFALLFTSINSHTCLVPAEFHLTPDYTPP